MIRGRNEDEEMERCPFCGDTFGLVELTEHAGECENRCLRAVSGTAAATAPVSAPATTCGTCKKAVQVEDLFILDCCSCRFHKACIAKTLLGLVAVSVNVLCPVCSAEVSMRDMKELTGGGGEKLVAAPVQGASARLVSELSLIKKAASEKSGYSAAPVKKNLFLWEVKLFGFEGDLAADMKKMNVDSIVMEFTFPNNFPFGPPFCRVLRPRFRFMTGHVTIGGSICTELLTQSGWVPQTTIESVIISIRTEMMAGGGRLDPSNKSDYSMAEAKDAYERMKQKHGW